MSLSFRQMRREIDYTQAQVADVFGVSAATIRRVEKEEEAPPLYMLAMEQLRHRYHQLRSGQAIGSNINQGGT